MLTNVPTLPIIITGGLKTEYYIRKKIINFLIFDQVLNGSKTTHRFSWPSWLIHINKLFLGIIAAWYEPMLSRHNLVVAFTGLRGFF